MNSKTEPTAAKLGQQQGFVAIFSVIIIMMVMTLIAVGFASLAQRAQRRTLDNQLSVQAYYAAESGVNDAIEFLENGNGDYVREDCNDALPSGFPSSVIDGVLGVEYTCLLITDAEDLRYTNITSTIATIKSEDGSNFNNITFEWSGPGQPSGSDENFRPADGWGNRVDVLRVDLTPLNNLNRSSLIGNTYTFFLYPLSGSGTNSTTLPAPSETGKGQRIMTGCNPDGSIWVCRMEANIAPGNNFAVRVKGLYGNPFNLTITPAFNNTTRRLADGQKNIDVTGKANDVLRRIQVRVPVDGGLGDSDRFGLRDAYGLTVGDHICKRYFVGDGFDAKSEGPSSPASAVQACNFD